MSFLRASSSACSCLPRTRLVVNTTTRAIHAPASKPLVVPATRGSYTTPSAILTAAGRNLDAYSSKLGEDGWSELFSKTSDDLAQMGMSVKERRYALWVLEKFRRGHDPSEVAIPSTPKKKIRGWGPKVQFGKRVR